MKSGVVGLLLFRVGAAISVKVEVMRNVMSNLRLSSSLG